MSRTALRFPVVFGDRPWWFSSPSKLICLKLRLPLPSMRHELSQMCKKYWYSRLLKTKQTNAKGKKIPSQCPLERPYFFFFFFASEHWDHLGQVMSWEIILFFFFKIYTHTHTQTLLIQVPLNQEISQLKPYFKKKSRPSSLSGFSITNLQRQAGSLWFYTSKNICWLNYQWRALKNASPPCNLRYM